MAQWVASMRAGDYAAAWTFSEQQLRERDPAGRDDPALPYHLRWVWDGRAFEGRHCLVRCYHGLGDTIQFARFLPALARRAASLTVEIQPRLIELLGKGTDWTSENGICFVPFDEARPLPPMECDLEITELDFALRASPADFGRPYLHFSKGILPRGTVGLCYGAGDWDPDRSVPADLFAPLCAEARCLTLMPEPTDIGVLNPEGCPFDMGTTASLVAACDLVITVDTMIAHLAGAMGRPTWLLLKAEPDWRWPVGRAITPWYPSIRIHAQHRRGDWAGVMTQVRHELTMFDIHSAER